MGAQGNKQQPLAERITHVFIAWGLMGEECLPGEQVGLLVVVERNRLPEEVDSDTGKHLRQAVEPAE